MNKNFEEKASQIFKEIKKAKRILLSLHRNPDVDSVGSNLAMYLALKKIGKIVEIISPDEISDNFKFLPETKRIKITTFSQINLEKYDLALFLDVSSGKMLKLEEDFKFPANLTVVVIDHHPTNENFGKINLVEDKIASCGEIIFEFFKVWNIDIDEKIANCLLAAIYGDTGGLRYPGTTSRSMEICASLIAKGVNLNEVVKNLFMSHTLGTYKFWELVFKNIKTDKKLKFFWSAVSSKNIKNFKLSRDDLQGGPAFFQTVKDFDIGLLLLESKKGVIEGHLRARGDIDVSQLAKALGGGGHKKAAGFYKNGDFEALVPEIINKVKEILKETNEKGH